MCECDFAGFWNFDLEAASFHIGAKITEKDLDAFKDRFVRISDELIFIPKFISFQYGELNENVKAHKAVIEQLNKRGIDLFNPYGTVNKELYNSYVTVQDKDKDKEKDNKRGDCKGGKTKPQKIIFDEIEYNDWEKLFAYWVQEKSGTKYTAEGKQYALGKLKDLSGDDFYVASEAIRHAALNKYQGFFNANGLFYDVRKGKKDIAGTPKGASASDIRAFLSEVKNEHTI